MKSIMYILCVRQERQGLVHEVTAVLLELHAGLDGLLERLHHVRAVRGGHEEERKLVLLRELEALLGYLW